ncbi:MAG: carboxypeptidase-like regulatory domain-containing protein, partial [Bacteroidia bacterium]|nr:carboxypeptidase-like regulatory domain-containing protein [Bacteroidia bacterium]
MKICLLKRRIIISASRHFYSSQQNLKAFLSLFFVLLSASVFAQQITVNGKVVSGDTVLSGVTVNVKNAATTTQTNDEGNFSINAPANGTLVFTYVGYTSQ